jgi:organic radical activating enzyme
VLCFETIFTPFSLFLEFEYAEFNKLEQLPEWYYRELKEGKGLLNPHIDNYMSRLANFYALTDNIQNCRHGINLIISEVCNLRCKECLSLMPYHTNPRHFDIERLKRSIDVFCEDRYIEFLFIEGGETFVYPDLVELFKYLLEIPQIEKILIATNGTIFPNEEVLSLLSDPKFLVRFSIYGQLSKRLEEFVSECDERRINYVVRSQTWRKFSAIPLKPHTEEEVKEIASDCCKLTGVNRPHLIDGTLYRCPFAGFGGRLGLFPVESGDYVDLLSNDDDLQDKINAFILNPKPVGACYYCSGRGHTNESVPVAEQLPAGIVPAIIRV